MKSRKHLNSIGGLGIVLMLLELIPMVVPSTGWAQKVDPNYFKGKNIEFIVPVAAGGGTDTFARFLSGWLPKFIPGNPVITVRNMPGANAMIGCNYVYKVAKKDGLTVLAASSGNNLLSLLQSKGVEYDLNNMPMVISASSGQLFYIKEDFVKNFKDVFDREIIIFGHNPAGGGVATSFILAKEILGFKTKKIILAYGGTGEARRAFLAGEINASGETLQTYEGYVKPLEKKGEIKILFQIGTLDSAGNVIRLDPPLGHIPTVYDRYVEIYGKPPSGKAWEAFKTLIGPFAVFEKGLYFPPGTPSEVVNIVGEACEKIVKDPKFIAEADAKLQSMFISGEPMRKIYDKSMIQANPEAISWLKTWLREKWGVD